MKAKRFFGALAAGAVLGLAFSACSLFAPTISIVSSSDSVYSDETFDLTATVSDDTLPVTWYLDGVAQSVTDLEVTAWFVASSSGTHTVYASVTKGSVTTTSETLNIYVTASGSLRIVNSSSISIYYLYFVASTATSWGSDLLGSNGIISNGSTYRIYGINSGYWSMGVELADATTATRTGIYFANGVPKTWTIYYSSNTLASERGAGNIGDSITDAEATSGCIAASENDIIPINVSK